jgi:hypothetical protein
MFPTRKEPLKTMFFLSGKSIENYQLASDHSILGFFWLSFVKILVPPPPQ